MRALPSRRVVPLTAQSLLTLALLACDGDGPRALLAPVDVPLILDIGGTLEAVDGATDTIRVELPADRALGAIIETTHPIVMRYGPGRYDVIHSSAVTGGFAAIVTSIEGGPVRLLVRRSRSEVVAVDYRVRFIAIDPKPEHAPRTLAPGDGFVTEWIDPPLDHDVFVVDLDEGESFAVDFESHADDVRMTARVVQPGGTGYYLFLEAGPELTRSDAHRAETSGEHRLIVYSAGLLPDVEARYRFRLLHAD